jgi:hypothetical protein
MINLNAKTDILLKFKEKSSLSQCFLGFFLESLINKARNIRLVGSSPFYLFFVPLLICVSLTISLADSSSLFLSPIVSETGKDINMNERPRLIEKGTKHVADEAYIKSWWIFSYNNKIYKIDEYQSVDDTTNRVFEQSKFQITNNN